MQINYLAVVVAALASMVVGSIWYAPPVFGRAWMALLGKKAEELGSAKIGYAISTMAALLEAVVLAYILAAVGVTDLMHGLRISLYVGLGFVAAPFAADYVFGGRPWKLYLLNVGNHVLTVLAMGAILSAWK